MKKKNKQKKTHLNYWIIINKKNLHPKMYSGSVYYVLNSMYLKRVSKTRARLDKN